MGIGMADDGTTQDLSIWAPVSLEIPVKNTPLYATLSVEPRISNNIREFEEVLIHPGLGYQINDNVSVEAGYTWLAKTDTQFSIDQRLWQDVEVKKKWDRLALNGRLRLEERWLPGVDDVFVRNRYLLGGRYYLGDTRKWYVTSQNEIFINLNNAGVRAHGIDQFRLFNGVGKHVNKNMTLESGYQLQYARKLEDPTRINHILVFRVSYTID